MNLDSTDLKLTEFFKDFIKRDRLHKLFIEFFSYEIHFTMTPYQFSF